MKQLEGECKELKTLRRRVRRSFGMARISKETYERLDAQIDVLSQALSTAGIGKEMGTHDNAIVAA